MTAAEPVEPVPSARSVDAAESGRPTESAGSADPAGGAAAAAMAVSVREVGPADLPVLWTLAVLPNIGRTADPSVPLPLPPAPGPPPGDFGDLADPRRDFTDRGGCFLVAEVAGHLAGMGGFRPAAGPEDRAEILRVRVHPALRRRGIGRAVMAGLETRARELGFAEAWLDTATNQPESMAFYEALGYRDIGQETRPEWRWTLVHYLKSLRF